MTAAKETTEVILEWIYWPPSFFESQSEISGSDYTLDSQAARISTRMPAAAFDADTRTRERLHASLLNRMRGIQLSNRKPFQLQKPHLIRIGPDGKRQIFVELEGAKLKVDGGSVDVTVSDASGKVIHDSKLERIDTKRELGELVQKYASGDDLLQAVLKSWDQSISDPDNELVHLYEIRDSLAKAFGGEQQARAKLNISDKKWKRLGRLCNDEPLRQGRHRGRKFENLRDATQAELTEARNMAREMIEAYLHFRDTGGKISP
jgi:hypothetical protein